jgi:hypothetical protein
MKFLRGIATALRSASLDYAHNGACVLGCLSISYGAWLFKPAAGFIVFGVFLIAAALLTTPKGD